MDYHMMPPEERRKHPKPPRDYNEGFSMDEVMKDVSSGKPEVDDTKHKLHEKRTNVKTDDYVHLDSFRHFRGPKAWFSYSYMKYISIFN